MKPFSNEDSYNFFSDEFAISHTSNGCSDIPWLSREEFLLLDLTNVKPNRPIEVYGFRGIPSCVTWSISRGEKGNTLVMGFVAGTLCNCGTELHHNLNGFLLQAADNVTDDDSLLLATEQTLDWFIDGPITPQGIVAVIETEGSTIVKEAIRILKSPS